ncbi:MAG TPA: reverse transcriptase domain-containing protein [Candidatus Bathyarchaeia archaeon]|nr:reverse transcriptase domain-containing protein [Candidatus Bathyarchaeia archaeon]
MLARDSVLQSNRLRLHSLVSSAKMDIKKYRVKGYTHFDNRISIEKVKDKIQNPCWVSKHGFYPFVHFKIEFQKYNKKDKSKKEKVRKIFYASHIDSFIYKYYGDELNNHYNRIANELGINEVATAYRNNLSGKSNINFAKEVIDFIKRQQNAYVFVADFTNFFDKLDHKYLKDKIKYVIKNNTLPSDYYNVFKNLTKYSYIIRDEIEREIKDKPKKSFKYFTEKEFRAFKYKNIYKNHNSFGIPQGAGISSVCSNIYLLNFDMQIADYVNKHKGIYRRYCDDLIIVLPIDGEVKDFEYSIHQQFVESVKQQIPNLEIQAEKTGNYFYIDRKIYDLNFNETKLDYLGFSFNGEEVRIREKSLFKYYSRAYRKVRVCNRISKEFGRKSYRRELYKNYTHLGKYRKDQGNFLSYVSRAQRIFDENSCTINLMEHQVKNHWKRINSLLEKH